MKINKYIIGGKEEVLLPETSANTGWELTGVNLLSGGQIDPTDRRLLLQPDDPKIYEAFDLALRILAKRAPDLSPSKVTVIPWRPGVVCSAGSNERCECWSGIRYSLLSGLPSDDEKGRFTDPIARDVEEYFTGVRPRDDRGMSADEIQISLRGHLNGTSSWAVVYVCTHEKPKYFRVTNNDGTYEIATS